MKVYSKIGPEYWDIGGLSFEARSLYVYLQSNAHSNWLGCYRCTEGYICDDLGLTRAKAARFFAELVAAGLVRRFDKLIFLPHFLAKNAPKNPNMCKARFAVFINLPDGEAKAACAAALLAASPHWGEELSAKLSVYATGNTPETVEGEVGEMVTQIVDATVPDTVPETVPVTVCQTVPDTVTQTVPVTLKESREKRVESINTFLPPVSAKPEPLAAQACANPPNPKARAPEPKPRPRNELVDALVSATGGDPLAATQTALKAAGVALAEIKTVCPELTPQIIDRAAKAYTRAHRDWPLTPHALAKNWHTLGAATTEPKADPLDPYRAPPPNWRRVMTRVMGLTEGVLDDRRWEDMDTAYRRETLREIHKC